MAFMDDLVTLWEGIKGCLCVWPIRQIRRTPCFHDLTANGYCNVFAQDENDNNVEQRQADASV